MTWKTKPVLVEAIEWTGKNAKEMEEEFGIVVNLDSLAPGSWIVKTAKGRLVVYTNEQFHRYHERELVWEDNI